jgi:hypothetical protein
LGKIFDSIYEYIKELEIIDTHEHLPGFEEHRYKNTDILREYLYLTDVNGRIISHYFGNDLISAGFKMNDFAKLIDMSIPIGDRWKLVEPYWELTRNTGYGRYLDISVNGIYGMDRIDGNTIEELNKKFMESLAPGHFRKVIKDKSKIKLAVLDSHLSCDREFFRSVYRLDTFINPQSYDDFRQAESLSGSRITCLDEWMEACEIVLDKAIEAGAVALKSGIAYDRTLKFDRVTKADAEEAFNSMISFKYHPISKKQKEFADYMMHYVLRMANKRNLTVQFHTGLHAGNANIISNSDPTLLNSLFFEYPDVNFVLMHIGYPYNNILSALAKNFPNVYIDMCWSHIISPTASINSLVEWLDSVPANKIFAFGGDSIFVDGIYGHQYLARINVSRALAKKVEEDAFDMDQAKNIANLIFYENPCKVFGLYED